MVTLFALALGTAQAQTAADWSIYPTVLLTGADVPYGSTVGSPSVIYDSVSDRYIMFFETFMANSPNCPAGDWGIGLATSPDGLNWNVSANPLIAPDPTSPNPTYHSCVAAHPGAIYIPPSAGGAPGGTVYVYFKAEQASDACAVLDPDPSWGCGQYTGVGSMRIRLRANGTISSTVVAPAPVLEKSVNFGYPKPLRYGDTMALSYTQYPDVYIATANTPTGPFTEQGVALAAADYTSLSWVEDEFYNAALACLDQPNFPLRMFAGGRDNDFGIVLNGGVGIAIADPSNILTWTLAAAPQFAFSGDDSFRHWDVLRVGASSWLLYYDERDASGANQVRLATTLPSFTWNNADVYAKYCF